MVLDGGVHVSGVGIVDDSDYGGLVDAESEGDANIRECVDEVGGAVDWIAAEGWFISEAHSRFVGFFSDEAKSIS